MLLPRGSLKTTIATVSYTVQQIVKNPDIRILLASETLGQSIHYLREIKGHFEAEKFKMVYGDWKPKTGWTDSEIIVEPRRVNKKEATITCAGIDVTKVGGHYDLIIIDDCHSQKNVTSRDQIDQVKNWYRLLLSLLEPQGRLLMVGTRWDFDDLYGHVLSQLREDYDVLVEKAIADTGELYWPERLSKDFLASQMREQGSYIFSCQYQQNPIAKEDQTFDPINIFYYDDFIEDVNFDELDKFIMVDPSLTEDERNRGDSTAMVVIGLDEINSWYILEVVNKKLSPDKINEILLGLSLKWKPNRIGIESVAFSKLLKPSFEKYCLDKANFIPPVMQLKTTGKSKEYRIKSLQPLYEQHKIYQRKPDFINHDVWYDLYEQLIHFPKASHDDIIDSLAYGNQLVYYRSIPDEPKQDNPYLQDQDGPWNNPEQQYEETELLSNL